MSDILDELDKRILRELCTGISSYDDLAQACNVTRNTIYRRVNRLENLQVISRKIMAIPDFSKLGLSAVLVGLDFNPEENNKIMDAVEELPRVKLVWRTYGDHQLILIMTCEKGFEGQAIEELRNAVAKLGVNHMHISVGYEWGKINFVPCW